MKKIFHISAAIIILMFGNTFADANNESKLDQFRRQFKNDYFSIGTLMQYVLDYQHERTLPGNNGFSIANMRMKLTGKFDGGIGYFFHTRFETSPAILDAYMSYTASPALVCRIGLYKSPFSKEFLISAADIDFVNRSRVVSLLAPKRQIGFQVGGQLVQNTLRYDVSISNGNSPKDNNNDNGKFLYTTRIGFFPKQFNNKKSNTNLEIGVNAAISKDNELTLMDGLLSDFTGDRTLWGADIRFSGKKLLLSGEYIHATMEPTSGQDNTPHGFHATAGYLLTPKAQLLVRWDQMNLDKLVAQNASSDWLIFGLNVWPTDVTGIQVNYIVDIDESDIDTHQILMNFQIAF